MTKSSSRFVLLAAAAALSLVLPVGASATPPDTATAVATFDHTENLQPLGFSARTVPLDNTVPGAGSFNSDLAFWGDMAVQGTYAGFRLIDISEDGAPQEIINFEECVSRTTSAGNQGDVVVWDDILVRSWNSPAPSGGRFCGGVFTPQGQEGVHIFDISDPANPVGLAFVPTDCGSHTATGVPDPENNRLLVYSSSASGSCRGLDLIEVPLDAPENAAAIGFIEAGQMCHDTAVILGDAMLAACAGHDGTIGNSNNPDATGVAVWSLDPADGASFEEPVLLYQRFTPSAGIGHSAAFTWDGEVLIVGHEPGGGGQARCQATNNPLDHTAHFLDARTGMTLGTWELPRKQTNLENCTIHNYNVVPTDRSYLLVSGNYQSGISVVDFTDPANAREVAYADPAPLVNPNNPNALELGGDWSTYWYNGRIYESDITRGLIVWNLTDPIRAGERSQAHLNPQTQEETFPLKRPGRS